MLEAGEAMAGAGFPREPESITAGWLSDVLAIHVSDFRLEQIAVGVGLLGRLYRVTLESDDGPRTLIAKFPTLDELARKSICDPLNFYEKEVRFYEQVAAPSPLRPPRAHFSAFDEGSGDFVLLLEDLGELRTADQTSGCAIEDAAATVDAIADHHAHWWESPQFASMPWLPASADPPQPDVIAAMFRNAWPRFLEGFGDRTPGPILEFGERFPELVPWFFEANSRPPVTFIHGDLRLDNLFYSPTGDGHRVRVVDWQITWRGRGAYDVAYFLSQSLRPSVRRAHEEELIARYLQRLADAHVDYPHDEFWTDYRRTVAFCFGYPVGAGGSIDIANDRHRELVGTMLEGAVAAIEDHDALALVPG